MNMKHDVKNVYLSFSRRDERTAIRIAKELRSLGFVVWDDFQIAAGANWAVQVAEALERADAIVLLISPEYLASQWAQREIEYALSTAKYKGRVIPVMLRPTRDVPWILETFQRIDATPGRRNVGKHIAEALRSSAEVGSH